MVQTKRMIEYYPVRLLSGLLKYQARRTLLHGFALSVCLVVFLGESLNAQKTSATPAQGSTDTNNAVAASPRIPGLASRLNRRMTSELWQERIGLTPATKQQIRDKHDFQEVIERLNSLHIRAKKAGPVPTDVDTTQAPAENTGPQTVIRTEPNDIDAGSMPPKSTGTADPTQTDTEIGQLSPGILERLTKLSDRPEALMNPFGIAEILYSTGHLQEAARFYEKALERVSRDDPADARKRAWIIFQRANCLRRHQPAQAMDSYQMLLSEHPDSPWRDSAQIWLKLAEWYSKEKPIELIQECEQLKVSVNRALDQLDS